MSSVGCQEPGAPIAPELTMLQRLDQRHESLLKSRREATKSEGQAESGLVLAEVDSWIQRVKADIKLILDSLPVSQERSAAVASEAQLHSVADDMQKLDNYLAVKSSLLATYDVKKIQANIMQLKTMYQEMQCKLYPPKKFGFKSKKKRGDPEASPAPQAPSPIIQASESHKGSESSGDHNIHDRCGETIDMGPPDSIRGKDLELSRLTGCRVKIVGCPSTVYISNLTDCEVLCGPVSTSVFIDSCQNTDLVVACHQLRSHRSQNCRLYLHVTSKAIIEDCDQMQVAPYNWSYDGIDQHFDQSGLSRATNNWDQLADFNWLSLDCPSPHWQVMPVSLRRAEWR